MIKEPIKIIALFGEAGVGKTAIAGGIAQRIVAGDLEYTKEIKDIQAIASELLPRKYAQYRNKLSLFDRKIHMVKRHAILRRRYRIAVAQIFNFDKRQTNNLRNKNRCNGLVFIIISIIESS